MTKKLIKCLTRLVFLMIVLKMKVHRYGGCEINRQKNREQIDRLMPKIQAALKERNLGRIVMHTDYPENFTLCEMIMGSEWYRNASYEDKQECSPFEHP